LEFLVVIFNNIYIGLFRVMKFLLYKAFKKFKTDL